MKIVKSILTLSVLIVLLGNFGCDSMEDNFKQYMEECNYSGKIDSLRVYSGFKRVVLEWENPKDQKSKSILIIYGPDSTRLTFDNLVNSALIEGLDAGTGYNFTVYTLDAYNNLSVPTSITAFPISQSFVNTLTPPSLAVNMADNKQVITLLGLSNVLMTFSGKFTYNVSGPDGFSKSGSLDISDQIISEDPNTGEQKVKVMDRLDIPVTDLGISVLPPGEYTFDYDVTVWPVLGDVRSVDEVTLSKKVTTTAPLVDAPISKKQWSFLRDNLLYGNKWDYNSDPDPLKQKPFEEYMGTYRGDSLKNAHESFYEGHIEMFWDNEYDYEPKQNLNYFHTGPQPYSSFSYFIDMGREIRASRFKVWQRESWGMLYTFVNVEICEIWISDDKDPTDGIFDGWEYVGRYKIVKPSSDIEARIQARNGHEFVLYPDNPRLTKPFRYLRYKGVKQFDDINVGCMSEITIFGIEADGSIIDDPETLTGVVEGWE